MYKAADFWHFVPVYVALVHYLEIETVLFLREQDRHISGNRTGTFFFSILSKSGIEHAEDKFREKKMCLSCCARTLS
jgi:hypothetical protein